MHLVPSAFIPLDDCNISRAFRHDSARFHRHPFLHRSLQRTSKLFNICLLYSSSLFHTLSSPTLEYIIQNQCVILPTYWQPATLIQEVSCWCETALWWLVSYIYCNQRKNSLIIIIIVEQSKHHWPPKHCCQRFKLWPTLFVNMNVSVGIYWRPTISITSWSRTLDTQVWMMPDLKQRLMPAMYASIRYAWSKSMSRSLPYKQVEKKTHLQRSQDIFQSTCWNYNGYDDRIEIEILKPRHAAMMDVYDGRQRFPQQPWIWWQIFFICLVALYHNFIEAQSRTLKPNAYVLLQTTSYYAFTNALMASSSLVALAPTTSLTFLPLW